MAKQHILGLKRFEACIQIDGYLVGSHGDCLCSASLRTGEIAFSNPDVAGDPKRRILDISWNGDDSVVAAACDGSLTEWNVDPNTGRCDCTETHKTGASRLLLVAAAGKSDSARRCFVLVEVDGSEGSSASKPSNETHAHEIGQRQSKKRKAAEVKDASSRRKDRKIELVCWSLGVPAKQNLIDGALPRGSDRPAQGGLLCVDVEMEEGTSRQRLVFCCRSELRVYANVDTSATLIGSLTFSDDPASALAVSEGRTAKIVTGHYSGMIRIWRQAFSSTSGRDCIGPCSILHWHASRVGAICTSTTDMYLLSGGSEAVLVLWQLVRGDKEARTFLPRLGGPIVKITEVMSQTDGTTPLAVVVTADNAIHAIAVTQDLARLWSHRGLCVVPPPPVKPSMKRTSGAYGKRSRLQRKMKALAAKIGKSRPIGAIWNGSDNKSRPIDGAHRRFACPVGDVKTADSHTPESVRLAVNARPGTLDIFDASEDRVVSTVDVVPHNRVRSAVADAAREPSVLAARFSDNARWLATIDTWVPVSAANAFEDDDDAFDNWQELKLWHASMTEGTLSYSLEAIVRSPHGNSSVAALAFHPALVLVASVAGDGSFKLWSRTFLAKSKVADDRFANEGPTQWTCSLAAAGDGGAEFDPRHHMDLPAAVAFSSDGSMAAVAHGMSVALWDLTTRAVVTSLSWEGDPMTLRFGPESTLLGVCSHNVTSWNLVTPDLGWAVDVESVAADVNSIGTFVVIAPRAHRTVVVFGFKNPEPIACFSIKGKEDPRCLAFLPNDNVVVFKGAHLVLIVRNGDVNGKSSSSLSNSSYAATSQNALNHVVVQDGDEHGQSAGLKPASNILREISARILRPNPIWSTETERALNVDDMFDAYLREQFRESQPFKGHLRSASANS